MLFTIIKISGNIVAVSGMTKYEQYLYCLRILWFFLQEIEKKGRFVMKNRKERNNGYKASARAIITMKPETLNDLLHGQDRELKEARFFAEDGGYMAARKTQEAIPMCLPLPVEAFEFAFCEHAKDKVEVRCDIHTSIKRTSAGMEALSAASMAAFILKERCNHLDGEMNVDGLEILEQAC